MRFVGYLTAWTAGLFVLTHTGFAWELGPAANYSVSRDSLNINGRFVYLETGGVGLQAKKPIFSQHVDLDVSALYGYLGSARATFSGADVSGPAHLSTYKLNITVYWKPELGLTPYVRLGRISQSGQSDFTGSRNGSPVRGRANLSFDTQEVALGFRVRPSGRLILHGEIGRYDWRLDSDASGTIGAIGAKTQIQADHVDPFFRVGIGVKVANWNGMLGFGQYQMTADNRTKSHSIDAAITYAFQ